MALLLTVAGAAASCPAVSCTSCVDTAFGHRIDDLIVEVYPNDASVCASDHVNLNFGVDYVTKNNLGGAENLIDANNGDHADTVADDLNNKVIARFLDEV